VGSGEIPADSDIAPVVAVGGTVVGVTTGGGAAGVAGGEISATTGGVLVEVAAIVGDMEGPVGEGGISVGSLGVWLDGNSVAAGDGSVCGFVIAAWGVIPVSEAGLAPQAGISITIMLTTK
jgi:hypothetical protein